jgi:preprotein translocase SecE subunit
MSGEIKGKKGRNIVSIVADVALFVPRRIASLFSFIGEAFAELKLVSWLKLKDTVRLSMYILVFVVVMALAFALTDAALYEVFKLITA